MPLKKKSVRVIFSVLFWILIWELISLVVAKEILLPSPIKVIVRLYELLGTAEYYSALLGSVFRVFVGFVVGTVIGCITAYLSFVSDLVATLFNPMLTVIRSTPVASFIILALVWMGKEKVPVFTAIIMVIPIVHSAMLSGLNSTDKALAEVADVYNFSYFKKLRLLYLPSALPSFASGAMTSFGLAWKAGIAAEVLCSLKNSIGGKIYTSKLYLESVDLMAWTLTVIVVSLILESIMSHLMTPIIRRYISDEVGGVEK